jgi:hypothetical protein
MLILHRGSFSGRDATCESWLPGSESGAGFPKSLTRRICELHRTEAPIEIPTFGVVTLGNTQYTVWNERDRSALVTIVGDSPATDVPFTMWGVGPIPRGSSLFRICLQMSPATFAAGIGRDRRFVACGEGILLDKITREDLPSYDGPDAAAYAAALAQFQNSDHVTPETFEYLVVGPEGADLPWETTPLSPRLLQPSIRSRSVERCTRWFLADTSTTRNWYLTGNAYSSFVVKVDAHDAAHAELEPVLT